MVPLENAIGAKAGLEEHREGAATTSLAKAFQVCNTSSAGARMLRLLPRAAAPPERELRTELSQAGELHTDLGNRSFTKREKAQAHKTHLSQPLTRWCQETVG